MASLVLLTRTLLPKRSRAFPKLSEQLKTQVLPRTTSWFPLAIQRDILHRKGSGGIGSISTSPPNNQVEGKVESGRGSMMGPTIYGMFEANTGTWQYIVVDTATMRAAIVDPVLDYDPVTHTLTDRAANSLINFIKETDLKVDVILETHIPKDHLSAAPYLQRWLSCDQGGIPPIYLGHRAKDHQSTARYNEKIPLEGYRGSCVKLLADKEKLNVGAVEITAMHLPGYGPHQIGYKSGDNVLCGNTILHLDLGTARCDLPGGNVHDLFKSCQKLLSLPDYVRIWPGHDSLPGGREPVAWMTVWDHKKHNKHMRSGIGKEEFVALRNREDAGLKQPDLLHQKLHVSLQDAGTPVSLRKVLQKPFLSLNLDKST